MKRFLFALVALLSLNNAFAQPMHLLPSANLHAWYPFCSATDVLDRTFNGFDLLSTAVSATTDRYGHPNKAYSLNGVNSELHYSTTFTIPSFGIADFSYSIHIYPTIAQNAIILYNGNPSANGLGLIMNNGLFGGGAGTVVSMLFGGIAQSVGTTVPINAWSHLLMKRNGNSYLLYLNGVLADTYIPPVTPGYTTPTTVFQYGADITSSNKFFTGKLDDIAIYDRQVSIAEGIAIRDFDPYINFRLASTPDTALCPGTIYLGGSPFAGTMVDTVTYPNSRYEVVGSPAWDLAYHYLWSTGDSASGNVIIFPSTPVPDTTRSLTISRPFSCPAQSAVTVHHTVPVLNIGRDTTFCIGDSVKLNPFPTTGPMVSYLWNTGATSDTLWADTTFLYICTMDSSFISVSGATIHCLAKDTANIVVTPHISVNLVNDTTLCKGGFLTLHSTYPYINPTYTWSDGITVTDTFHVTTTGTYWLQVVDSACKASDTVHVIVVYDTLTVFNPDTAICQGAFVIVRATSGPGIDYQWIPTSGIPISNVPSTTISPDTSATYVLEGTITLGGTLLNCHTRDTLRIDVQPVPRVDMGGNRTVCQYDSIRITPMVTPNWYTHYSYDWTPGTYLDDSTSSYAVFTAGDTTKIVLVVTTPAGCKGTDSIIIYTYNGDFASMRSDTSLCPGDSVKLFPSSSEPGITTYVWHPATYVNDTIKTNPVIRPITSINYTGIATSQYGCKDTLFYHIKMNPGAVIHMEDSAVIFPGESYSITPTTNCHFHQWSPPEGLSDTASINPVATPSVNTNFILTATTEDGCKAKDSIRIRVVSSSVISIPNAFAPGSINGTLKVILRGIARLRFFRIYNRWGQLVFEGKNIDNGWDGTLNGVAQPAGVYIYEAEAVTSAGQIIHKQGNVTLLK